MSNENRIPTAYGRVLHLWETEGVAKAVEEMRLHSENPEHSVSSSAWWVCMADMAGGERAGMAKSLLNKKDNSLQTEVLQLERVAC